jgi:hypothetical protein
MEEKLCHAVAILAAKSPDLYERLAATQEGVDMIWAQLSIAPETAPLYSYLCAKISVVDRNYLLLGISQNVVNK